jgi:hypothetical protein
VARARQPKLKINCLKQKETTMSTRPSVLSAFPAGLAATEGATGPGPARVICVVAAAWVQDFASYSPGSSAMRAQAEAREALAADGAPQVYCRRHGTEHAAKGSAPCTDLGCTDRTLGD